MVALADLTTLRVGGAARHLVTATTEAELVDGVRAADAAGEPVLLLAGGSNLLVSDEGFDGVVIRVGTRGIETLSANACGGVMVTVAAGEPWDDVVAHAVATGWAGIESLAGIPGSTGATPMQNVGAYGQEVASTIARVRTYDRGEGAVRTFMSADCGFGYRTSRFKGTDRYVVLDVTFQLRLGALCEPVRYAELASALDVPVGGRAALVDVPPAVLALRRRKGMLLNEADHDTWSAGSFFTNPVVVQAPDGAPTWPAGDGLVKVSAAWLIEHAGFSRGYPGGDAPVALSSKHTLALTNRGSGTASDVVALAREIRGAVRSRFGIVLEPEPRLVGLSLDD
ncbi:MAG: UDP-N-acetylmuramate dehydrogenase [Jiangellales bacterium]